MFALWCPTEDRRVLRWSSHVVHVAHPAPGAIDLLVRCECGAHVLWRTGRARAANDEFVHGIDALVAA
jgi:hypothetical protein